MSVSKEVSQNNRVSMSRNPSVRDTTSDTNNSGQEEQITNNSGQEEQIHIVFNTKMRGTIKLQLNKIFNMCSEYFSKKYKLYDPFNPNIHADENFFEEQKKNIDSIPNDEELLKKYIAYQVLLNGNVNKLIGELKTGMNANLESNAKKGVTEQELRTEINELGLKFYQLNDEINSMKPGDTQKRSKEIEFDKLSKTIDTLSAQLQKMIDMKPKPEVEIYDTNYSGNNQKDIYEKVVTYVNYIQKFGDLSELDTVNNPQIKGKTFLTLLRYPKAVLNMMTINAFSLFNFDSNLNKLTKKELTALLYWLPKTKVLNGKIDFDDIQKRIKKKLLENIKAELEGKVQGTEYSYDTEGKYKTLPDETKRQGLVFPDILVNKVFTEDVEMRERFKESNPRVVSEAFRKYEAAMKAKKEAENNNSTSKSFISGILAKKSGEIGGSKKFKKLRMKRTKKNHN